MIFSLIAEAIRIGSALLIPGRKQILEWELEELRKLREEIEHGGGSKYQRVADAIREASEIENVWVAIDHLKASAKQFLCPVCRAIHVHMVKYLLEYHYKTKLIEEGVDRDRLNEEFEKRYRKKVEEIVEMIKRELNVSDFDYDMGKEKFKEMLVKVIKG